MLTYSELHSDYSIQYKSLPEKKCKNAECYFTWNVKYSSIINNGTVSHDLHSNKFVFMLTGAVVYTHIRYRGRMESIIASTLMMVFRRWYEAVSRTSYHQRVESLRPTTNCHRVPFNQSKFWLFNNRAAQRINNYHQCIAPPQGLVCIKK